MESANCCRNCGWANVAVSQPAARPPYCPDCGRRNGAEPEFMEQKGIPAKCRVPYPRADEEHFPKCPDAVNNIPYGAEIGCATERGNNC